MEFLEVMKIAKLYAEEYTKNGIGVAGWFQKPLWCTSTSNEIEFKNLEQELTEWYKNKYQYAI